MPLVAASGVGSSQPVGQDENAGAEAISKQDRESMFRQRRLPVVKGD